MTAWILHETAMLKLLWLALLTLAFHLFAAGMRRQTLRRFISSDLLPRAGISVSPLRRAGKALLGLLALSLVVIALARPASKAEPRLVEWHGRDVVFILDVSNSMLAEDVAPNRLERAKLAILDCLETLEGTPVALVAFAGNAAVVSPLTLDHSFFRMVLAELSPRSVSSGGTMIGDGIRKALTDLFDRENVACRDIILVTDGEDQGSFPLEAARLAGERGVRLLAIGLGNEDPGSRVPVFVETDPGPPRGPLGRALGDGGVPVTVVMLDEKEIARRQWLRENPEKIWMQHNGEAVWSRLDADLLRRMAALTPGGQYFNVATGAIDHGVFERALSAPRAESETGDIDQYHEHFQIFLALALALLALEIILPERKRLDQ